MTLKIKLAIAILKFLWQLLKWMDKTKTPEQRTTDVKVGKFVLFRQALQEAEEGKVHNLENMFKILDPHSNVTVGIRGDDQLQDNAKGSVDTKTVPGKPNKN